ncbi:hypothetical protein ACFQ78_28300 [Streptomyces sp. NPDC056519]|uniref:hypothetical protein n=1 Tax=Streptomyces sp. NPDC056519 TaxID=3345849 RepID=UPI0036CFC2A3
MPFKKSSALALASLAAIGIAASAVPASAVPQVNERPANTADVISVTDSPVDSKAIVREFTIKNTTGLDLKVEGFTDPKTHDGRSQWVNRPRIGAEVKNGATTSWSATPYESALGRTALEVVLLGNDARTGTTVSFTVRMKPGIVSSGIACAQIKGVVYTCTGGGSVGKRDITLTHG